MHLHGMGGGEGKCAGGQNQRRLVIEGLEAHIPGEYRRQRFHLQPVTLISVKSKEAVVKVVAHRTGSERLGHIQQTDGLCLAGVQIGQGQSDGKGRIGHVAADVPGHSDSVHPGVYIVRGEEAFS